MPDPTGVVPPPPSSCCCLRDGQPAGNYSYALELGPGGPDATQTTQVYPSARKLCDMLFHLGLFLDRTPEADQDHVDHLIRAAVEAMHSRACSLENDVRELDRQGQGIPAMKEAVSRLAVVAMISRVVREAASVFSSEELSFLGLPHNQDGPGALVTAIKLARDRHMGVQRGLSIENETLRKSLSRSRSTIRSLSAAKRGAKP